MTSIQTISFSGMRAAQASLDASAHNIANLSTGGFHRQEVVQSTTVDGGVTTSVSRAAQEGSAPEADVVARLAAKNQFLANLAVFRTGDQMLGSLLDASS